MAQYELLLPKMGESVAEATVIKWVKQPGDSIELDDTILEIATDKVDSEVPSPVVGTLVKQLFAEDEVAQVGDVIAIIETEGGDHPPVEMPVAEIPAIEEKIEAIPGIEQLPSENKATAADFSSSDRFYSPLVKSIAAQENISLAELDAIKGSGADGRLNKDDLLNYIANRNGGSVIKAQTVILAPPPPVEKASEPKPNVQHTAQPAVASKPSTTSVSGGDEIIEMDRMRKLIADHMVMSKATSPHVTSFVEADVTNMVLWRNKVKNSFEKRENEKITFTPIFVEAVAKAIKDFPMINVSVNGTQIIKKRDINIGMAAALPSGNLIVPVIRNADQLNLVGLTKAVNDLATRARNSKLKPDETQGGTFTLTNVGSFGNVMGTPIINQPQVAILAVGAIKKKPAVLETEHGDVIAIRHMMFLSLSYDHRVVDGSLGGMFVRRVADYLESWDLNREI
ncbi:MULTISPECIES: dihydrolipoamide acetyltransferase family protein [unclassified Pedobacter]|uniref:dihydrolipoamide acetyltransferase family protein n=1 Tax=unclassified Pedobacter TaxID=2628915 RepID=UPI00141E088A|nr:MULTISPECIES: dihydrolipoamide acetyltransferase family protein [unclassified Pedobacter]NII82956.1 2-oxoglutarate dehydrogenase E2 component (dihydrolipoamide succinyltransferase) [Pedobacter sp. SG908]NMN36974.1 2-oxoglutarate dehydrogenase E2 component (dihydrolipoamide succinyltransferase) [Pedobacter sp. SG918]